MVRRLSLCLALAAAACLGIGIVCSAPITQPPHLVGVTEERQELLTRYGYLSDKGGSASGGVHSEQVAVAIKNLQSFAGIPVSGVLDDKTVELLESERCGVKDPIPDVESGSPIGSFILQGTKWQKRDLTYKIISYTEDLPPERQLQIFRKAFDHWQAASTLTFTDVTDKTPAVPNDEVDILISYGTRDHGDRYPFDGQGGTLAHAYYPLNNQGLAGDAHFDDAESFTTQTRNGINLDFVALHEFGHSVGLAHSNIQSAVMYPWYRGYLPNIALDADDISGIQRLYGKPEAPTTEKPTTEKPTTEEPTTEKPTTKEPTTEKPTTEEPTTEKPTTEEPTTEKPTTEEPTTEKPTTEEPTTEKPTTEGPTPEEPTTEGPTPEEPTTAESVTEKPRTEEPIPVEPDVCDVLSYDAFFVGADGKTYAVTGAYYWIIGRRAGVESGPHRLADRFPSLQTPVDAAFTKNGKTTFFKGLRFWRYRYDTNDERFVVVKSDRKTEELGLPLVLNDMDAVLVYSNNRIYFLKGDLYWRYNEFLRRMDTGYPKRISEGWSGLVGPFDGAMTWNVDGNSYFFQGENYFRINSITHEVDSGYPQKIEWKWMKCPV